MNKKELLESIMEKVSIIIEQEIGRHLQEERDNIKTVLNTEKAIDIHITEVASEARKILSVMNSEELEKFKADYALTSQSVCMHRYGTMSYSVVEAKRSYSSSSAKKLATEIRQLFKLEDFQVRVEDPFTLGIPNIEMVSGPTDWESLTLIISSTNENISLVSKFMENHGYTLNRKYAPTFDNINFYYVLIYTPIKQIDRRNELRLVERLYHVTASKNITDIIRTGLLPKPRKGTADEGGIIYPLRIFFFTDADDAIRLRDNFATIGEQYTVLSTDTHEVTKRMPVFYDPLYGRNAVYVEEIIPGELLRVEDI